MSHAMAAAGRQVLRRPGPAMLATLCGGAPEASLVTIAMLPDLSPVLMLSRLSRHSMALREDARCALLVTADPAADGMLANPQLLARITVRGRAAPDPDPGLRRRYLALHPYAAAYADFTDFEIHRMRIEAADLVLGFGRAATLTREQLLADAVPVADFLAREVAAIRALPAPVRTAAGARLFAGLDTPDLAAPELVAIDPDGADWIGAGRRVRHGWTAILSDPDGLAAMFPAGSDQPCDASPLA